MTTCRKSFIFILFAATTLVACNSRSSEPIRQSDPVAIPSRTPEKPVLPGLDKSPLDMSFFPEDYPVMKMSGKASGNPIARVIYSRPIKDGRVIFGDVVKYGSHWRLGANEASELEFFTDVKIGGKAVKKGRYVIYCIPYKDKWNIILNSDLFVWGLKINSAKDVYSFDAPVQIVPELFEAFTMEFEPAQGGMGLVMAWDHVKAILPIAF